MLPLFNLSSLLAFLTWFGASGYLLVHYAAWSVLAAVIVSLFAGAGGSAAIGFFLARVLAGERVMNPLDYQMEGTLARVSISIPAGGVGEIIFSQAGSRRSNAARDLTGHALARDTEVVVLAYERGVATVQEWNQFVRGEPGLSSNSGGALSGENP